MALHIVILAAGLGKRMHSDLPKVLHALGGKPLLAHVIETATQLSPETIHVIIGHSRTQIQERLQHYAVNWIHQTEQLGTGHAVMQALPSIPADADILVLSGDVPLIETTTLQHLIDTFQNQHQAYKLGLLLAQLDNPFGLGRIIRNSSQQITAIIEEKDASEAQRQIKEVYSGMCCAKASDLQRWLPLLQANNAQNEYYLTNIISMAAEEGHAICSVLVKNEWEIAGVNDRCQLHHLERVLQRKLSEQLMQAGVTLADAERVDVRGDLQCGRDVFIDVNTVFQGQVILGDRCQIGPNCVLHQVVLGPNCKILANSVLDQCILEANCEVGPFARLRPGTRLLEAAKVGNFVEVKNSTLGQKSKANHLSYIGDAVIGSNVNIGAGTITCNYDGANKHQTIIEDGVNIGSDTQLVAPVTIGKNATIGAGSTIRKNAPPEELTLTTTTQKTIYGWKRKS